MTLGLPTRIVGPLFVIIAVGPAHASPTDDALEDVNDAIDAAEQAGRKCEREAVDDLLEIRDLLRDGSERRAASELRSVRRSLRRCPPSVDRALRRASDALEANHDRPRDRRRDRFDDRDRSGDRDRYGDRDRVYVEPPRPTRPKGVPYSDWAVGCPEHWVAVELARGRTSGADLDAYVSTFAAICDGRAIGQSYYPSGTMAKSAGNDFYYPSGTMARAGNGAFYYPNGTMARSSNGDWYYPSGTMACTSSGQWYYPNGTMAGSPDVMEAWALARASKAQVTAYRIAMNSDLDLWRSFALLRMASQIRQ